jgi:glycogen synthase
VRYAASDLHTHDVGTMLPSDLLGVVQGWSWDFQKSRERLRRVTKFSVSLMTWKSQPEGVIAA